MWAGWMDGAWHKLVGLEESTTGFSTLLGRRISFFTIFPIFFFSQRTFLVSCSFLHEENASVPLARTFNQFFFLLFFFPFFFGRRFHEEPKLLLASSGSRKLVQHLTLHISASSRDSKVCKSQSPNASECPVPSTFVGRTASELQDEKK